MIINPANLNLFFTNCETRWSVGFSTTERWIESLADIVPCTTEQMAFAWIGMYDRMREWRGSRVVHQPAPQTYLVTPKPYELTEGIDEFKLKDDQFGVYFSNALRFGQQTAKWPDYEMRDLIQNLGTQIGQRQLGTDQLTHWNTAHPIDYYDPSKGTYSNDFSGNAGTAASPGGAWSVNGFNSAWQEFAGRKSENGEPFGINADLAWAGTQMKAAMMTVLQSKFIGMPQIGTLGSGSGANGPMVGATENVLVGWTDLKNLADFNAKPTTWYLAHTTVFKPFNFVLREAPDFVARTSPQDPLVFDRHQYVFGSMARGIPAWGLPWLSARSAP